MPISLNGTTGAVTGIVSASSTDLSTALVPRTGATGTINLSTATLTGAGMDLITTQSFSAVSSVSINNCFTSSYENYCILVKALPSATSGIQFRYRASGVDAATSYTYAYVANDSGTSSVVTGTANQAEIDFISTSSVRRFLINCFEPNVAAVTVSLTQFHNYSGRSGFVANRHDIGSAVHDGITIFPSSGTITGNIRVYGYRNS
jgi:hypothetical protein